MAKTMQLTRFSDLEIGALFLYGRDKNGTKKPLQRIVEAIIEVPSGIEPLSQVLQTCA